VHPLPPLVVPAHFFAEFEGTCTEKIKELQLQYNITKCAFLDIQSTVELRVQKEST
jgi:hypothetical protein